MVEKYNKKKITNIGAIEKLSAIGKYCFRCKEEKDCISLYRARIAGKRSMDLAIFSKKICEKCFKDLMNSWDIDIEDFQDRRAEIVCQKAIRNR